MNNIVIIGGHVIGANSAANIGNGVATVGGINGFGVVNNTTVYDNNIVINNGCHFEPCRCHRQRRRHC